MNLAAVRKLVQEQKLPVIQNAIMKFEADRSNPLGVEGEDDGEKLSNLLVAEYVLKKISEGMNFNEAIRDYSQRVRSFVGHKG